ncbi:MAG: hypothetical protein ABL903_07480 [Methylococcales bacterium]
MPTQPNALQGQNLPKTPLFTAFFDGVAIISRLSFADICSISARHSGVVFKSDLGHITQPASYERGVL